MSRPKILFVIDSLRSGGSERSLVDMLPALVRAGFEPSIACFYRDESDNVEQVIGQGISVHCLNESGPIARIRALRKLIERVRPQLVHTSLVTADIQGRLASIRQPSLVLTSLVNVPYDAVRFRDPRVNANKLRLIRAVDGWTGRHLTDHFHAVSHTAKQGAIDALGIQPERITVVERGRSVQQLGEPSPARKAQARRLLELDADDEVVVNVGRQVYQKGQRFLLDAVGQLAAQRDNLMLIVAGPQGGATAELEQLHAQSGLGDRVRFLGNRTDVPEILAAADLFVFPSLYEGLPGALIEAIALGLPVVASNIAPVAEVVEDRRNALLVPPESSVDLADAIRTLLEERPMAQAFGERSREIFLERFTLERSMERMVELYDRLLNQSEQLGAKVF